MRPTPDKTPLILPGQGKSQEQIEADALVACVCGVVALAAAALAALLC